MTDELRDLVAAGNEINSVLLGYENPEKELFRRYLGKTEDEREVMVLAMAARLLRRPGLAPFGQHTRKLEQIHKEELGERGDA